MTSDEKDPRTSLMHALDMGACRVEFSSKPVVLLCGGYFKLNTESTEHKLSLRDAINNFTPYPSEFELFYPEHIKGWNADNLFPDLISFEKELASICSLVVIILESEGALAEIGAFSQLKELSNKLIAIRSEIYAGSDSFINLGILRFLTAQDKTAVKTYPWNIKNTSSITTEIIADVIDDIKSQLKKQPKTQNFKITLKSHVMVLICQIIFLFIAIKESEIFQFLKVLRINTTNPELRSQLFLLTEFKLIKQVEYSDSHFYVRSKEDFHKLVISTKDKAKPFDELRFRTLVSQYYLTNISTHKNRCRAISKSAKERT